MTRRVKSSGIPNKNGISSGLRSKKQNADFGLLLTVSMNKTTYYRRSTKGVPQSGVCTGARPDAGEGKEPCGVLLLNL